MKDVSSLVSELFTIILIVSRSGYRTNWPLGLGELLHDPQSLSERKTLDNNDLNQVVASSGF